MIEYIKKKLGGSPNLINVIKISFGTIGGQVISIVTLPIFTRMYGTEVIGIWALFNSIATIVNSFSDLGMSNSIMIENDDKERLKIYKVITSISIIISIGTSILIYLYYIFIDKTMKLNSIFIGIFILVAIFTLQQIQICYTWLNKQGKYNLLMKNPLINNGIFGIVAIILGMMGFKKYGYYLGWIIGQIITLIHMKRFLPKEFITFRYEDYKNVIMQNKQYVVYQLPANIMTNFKNQLPVLMIESFFGVQILGYYSICVKLLNVPISLIAKSMGRVYFKTISDMKKLGTNIGEFTLKSIIKATKISVIPMIILIGFGDIIVNIIFGNGNEVAGIMIRVLAIQYVFLFLSMSVHGLPIVVNKQKYTIILATIQSFVIVGAFVIGASIFSNVYIALTIMSVLYSIINIVYFCKLFIVMNVSWKKYAYNVIKNIIVIISISCIARLCLLYIGIVSTM